MLDDQLFGIFRAIVTDISCFEKTGKIKTRISAFNSGTTPKDLINGYDSDSFADIISRDVLTDIMLPFGGGTDYGMFKLPQVNSTGLVAFINGSKSNPIWIGATANSVSDSDNNLIGLDFPSDKDNNEPAIYYDNGVVFNMNDSNSFIIKTKTNKLDDYTKPETMVWANNPVENSMIMNSAKLSFYHRVDDDTYQEFILDNGGDNNEGSITLGYVVSEDEFKRVTFDDSTIIIRNKNGDVETKMILDDDGGIYITAYDDSLSKDPEKEGSRVGTSIELTPASINLKSGHSNISMSRNVDYNNENVTITTSNLQVLAKNISFGSSGYSLVVSPSPNLNFTLEDGSMLTTANNIRV